MNDQGKTIDDKEVRKRFGVAVLGGEIRTEVDATAGF